MQRALRSKANDTEKIKERAHTHFSCCPFCGTEYPLSYRESLSDRYMFCRNCGRKWSLAYSLGTIWFLRANGPHQKKKYTGWWIVHRVNRALEGIRPYLLLEKNYSNIKTQKVVEQGLDRLVWKVQPLLECFDRYDTLVKGHSCERIEVAFACARIRSEEEREEASGSGLSVRQVAAVTDLSELEASNCTQRLLDEGLISYEVRPERGLTGVEAVIVGFLGEPLYQMSEHDAEKLINRLIR